MRSERGKSGLPREPVTLPGIRSLFPNLWKAPRAHFSLASAARKLLNPHFDSGIAVELHDNASTSRPPLSDFSSGVSMQQISGREHSLLPVTQDTTGPSPSLVPSVLQLPPSLKTSTFRKDSSSNYTLGIMRLHPLTADLEHVASSSSVSSPPRAHLRTGLMPYNQEEPVDTHSDDILTACAQPLFRVTVPTSRGCTTLEHPSDEVDKARPHRCPHCGKGFNRPSSLVTHVNMHTGAKPYPCLFAGCPRHFNVKSNMRRHYQRHLRPRHPLHKRAASSTSSALASSTTSDSRSPSPLVRRSVPQMRAVHAGGLDRPV